MKKLSYISQAIYTRSNRLKTVLEKTRLIPCVG
jgi:hypothetical protein